MFKAYASSVDEKNEDRKPAENNNVANIWLENKSFATELPTFSSPTSSQRQTTVPVQSKEIKPEKKLPIKKPSEPKPSIEEPVKDTFYIDRRRDRANITVQYTHGVPHYGAKFCNQNPLGSRATKPSRKQRIVRYFHQKFDETDNHPSDTFVRVDERLETLNRTVREQPHLFDAWKDLINYQFYLYKTTTDQDQLLALYNKQLSIIDRAVELNSNRLQYRLLQINLRCQSHLFNSDFLLSEWKNLLKDSLKSSDDRTINEIWSSYIQFHLNHIEIFSIERLHEIFQDFISTYVYHIQTKSEKGRRFLIDHMLDTLHTWTCVLRDAGYVERGLGVYQVMLNINMDFNEKNFHSKVQNFEQHWNTDRRRFGEGHVPENLTEYIENELKKLSEQENQLFDSTYRSWLLIEQLRIDFYQSKFVNQSIHFHSKCLQTLDDPSQLDDDIIHLSFTRHIRPFLFQLIDQRQLIQLIIYYLDFLNGLPEFTIVQELVNKLKIVLPNSFQDQTFLEQEYIEFTRLVPSKENERELFSLEYISNIYEQIIALPALKTYQIEFILFYWYYVAANLRQLKQQNSSLYKSGLKSFQNLIKKYLSLDEYRTCLRLYTHYARIEFEYLQRRTESRRIFDLCYQTIRTNIEQYSSFDSSIDLCHWLTTNLSCELNFNSIFEIMKKIILNNQKFVPLKQDFNTEKFSSLINFVLKKLFPTMEYNDIITLVLNCLKNEKISKWDQSSTDNWSNYLRQNPSISFELLFLFLNYSYLLNDPFEKLHQIVIQSILPLITDQHRKFHQTIIDSIIRFYLVILWNELFTEHLLFSQCTNYLKEFFDKITYPSIILLKFTSIYTCLLPLYGNYVKEFEQTMLSYESNKKIEYRFMNKYFVFQMNFIRHIKIQKSNLINEKIQSGYEYRVRHILRQLVQDYPSYRQLWNIYLCFEYSSVNNQRYKGLLYDAMQNCPSTKTFYLRSISQASNESEWKLFVSVMLRSNLHILFSVEEYDLLKELFEMKI